MSSIQDLRHTVARLRSPTGCPWDREQTHQSLAQCLVEETSELLETIDKGDMDHMREELGDVLLQVVFHAQLAEERGTFDLEDVAREINEKLIRRHPHVFGTASAETSDEVLVRWEEIKAQEKQNKPAVQRRIKELPSRLPALLFASDLLKQLKKGGIDAPVDTAQVETLAAGLDEAAAGRQLFALVAACRAAKIDPESALRRHAQHIIDDVENGS